MDSHDYCYLKSFEHTLMFVDVLDVDNPAYPVELVQLGGFC